MGLSSDTGRAAGARQQGRPGKVLLRQPYQYFLDDGRLYEKLRRPARDLDRSPVVARLSAVAAARNRLGQPAGFKRRTAEVSARIGPGAGNRRHPMAPRRGYAYE